MKIAFSSNGKDENSMLDDRFGRCEYFLIYDTDKKEFNCISNDGNSASGGAGIAASNQIVNEKVDAIVSGRLGPNALEIISKAKIKVYTCGEMDIKTALEKFENSELEEIED